MSLLRLLRAGKSLVGSGESGARYRLLSGPALPKFGTDKNPFREPSRTRAENATAEPAVPASACLASAPRGPGEDAPAEPPPVTPDLPKLAEHQDASCEAPTVKAVECKPAVDKVRKEKRAAARDAIVETSAKPETPDGAGSASSVTVGKPVGVVAAGAKAAARVLRLNSKLNPFVGWARPKGGARALPRTNALVQGELSLDRVKVVRNDLSDSDLEIVSAKKPSPPPAPAPAAELAATVSSSPRAWERVTSRLFGAGKT
jgi:hypothetical protein